MSKTNYKKITSLFLSFLLMVTIVLPINTFKAKAEEGQGILPAKEIKIISFTDFHGSLKPEGKNVGVAKLAGEIKKIKIQNPDTIVVSGGDNYQGSAMSNLTYGEPVSEFLKSIGLFASAVGNHEFDWGVSRIENWAKAGSFDFLASNIYDKETGKPVSWAKPYKIAEIAGKKIAFIGLTTKETEYKTKPENVKNLEFKDPNEAAKYWTDYLKDNKMADYVIALTHLGAAQDSKTGEISGEAAELAKKVSNLDGIIAGHTHMSVCGTVNNIPIVEGYYNGRTLATLTIQLDKDGKLIAINPSLDELYKRVDKLSDDEEVKGIYDKWNEKLKPILDEVIGKTDVELSHDKNLGVSLLGEWACDVMRKEAGTEIAVTNGGGLRTSIPAGNITMGKLYEVMPFDNTLVKMQLKGSDLKKVIENGIDNKNVGWIQLSGVKVYYNPQAEAGNRITSMRLLDGKKIEDDKLYSVVTNDFMADGGDGYDFKGAVNKIDTGVPIRDALVKNIKDLTANGKSIKIEYIDYLIAGEDTTPEVIQSPVKPVKTVKIVALKGLRIRAAASVSSKILGVYKNGTEVVVEGEVGNWYRVNYKGFKGYIYKKYTK